MPDSRGRSHHPQPGKNCNCLGVGSLLGIFALLYVPGKVIVRGNPTATAHNIAAHAGLFRWGIVADLAGQAFFILVALALYHLLKAVHRKAALLMLVLLLVSIPIAFLNELNSVAALQMARGADTLSLFDESQRVAWMRLFLNLRGTGFDIAGIFWGLWLFPLGWLVYRFRIHSAHPRNPADGGLFRLSSKQRHVARTAAVRCCRVALG